MYAKNCVTCGAEFKADEEWKTKCPACFSKKVAREHTDKKILRQVMLKIASEQNPNSTPEKIIEYAKTLEAEWDKWD